MNLDIKDKIIIVTGGSKGIGGGIVSLLAKEGAVPIIIGRNKKRLIKLKKKINKINTAVNVVYIVTDLSTNSGVNQIFQKF